MKYLKACLGVCLLLLVWNNVAPAGVNLPYNLVKLLLNQDNTWTGDQTFNNGIIIPPNDTAVDIDVTTSGSYHATASTIFKVNLSSYTGKTLTFSTEVTGTTVWFTNAISVGRYGGASGVSLYNNVDQDFVISVYGGSATSLFVTDLNGTVSYEPIG